MYFNKSDKTTEKNKSDYKSRANEACDLAFTEIYFYLKKQVGIELSKDYVDCLHQLDLENFCKLKSWLYVRVKQILVNDLGLSKDELFGKNNFYSETDKRFKIYKLIQDNFYPLPQFKKQLDEEECNFISTPLQIKQEMQALLKPNAYGYNLL